MSNPRYLDLDLTVSQVQDNVGLTNILDPRYLSLAIHQVQGNVSLSNIPDLRHLDFVVQHVQGNDHPPLSTSKTMTILPWAHAHLKE